MHDMMAEKRFEQVPQLSSSRVKDLNNKVQLIHPGGTGKTRAVLIGINYTGSNAELRGCWNDVESMKNWLVKQVRPSGVTLQRRLTMINCGMLPHEDLSLQYRLFVAAFLRYHMFTLHTGLQGGPRQHEDSAG
eukprot:9167091-Pyramimonas_sp.AAC.1